MTVFPTLSSLAWLPLQAFSGNYLFLAVIFFVLALIAAVVGQRGITGMSMRMAKMIVIVFVVLGIVSLLL